MLSTRVVDKKTLDAAILDSDAGIVGHDDLKGVTSQHENR
jgi:hypothetical protein